MIERHVALLALNAFGGQVRGKTLLQKRFYFLGELLRLDFEFDAHYYGPYSAALAGEMASLSALALAQEDVLGFGDVDAQGFERRRYQYRLTEDGHKAVDYLKRLYPNTDQSIRKAVERLRQAGELNYMDLSIAAKAHFILKRAGKPMTPQSICEEARKFAWQITDEQIAQATEFLRRLGLLERVAA